MINNTTVLITGATGVVGGALARHLAENSKIVAPVRKYSAELPAQVEQRLIGDINGPVEWSGMLNDVDCVVHCAARVHVMQELDTDAFNTYRQVNVIATRNLARAAAAAGVKRFVFVSTIKVNGESTLVDTPFRSTDDPAPKDFYGMSKWEAEQELKDIETETGMEVVIVRLPMVYGPAAKGNFDKLVKLVRSGIPLPLGKIENKRSFIYVGNVVEFLALCVHHKNAAGHTFLISDNDDVSTTELLRAIARAINVKVRLLPVPADWISRLARLVGREEFSQRLLGSLTIDSSDATNYLDWSPSYKLQAALSESLADDDAPSKHDD